MTDQRERNRLFDLVKELTELPGPVGHEDAVQDRLAARWEPVAAEVRRTRVGNILARVGGHGRRLVLVAHADEICLMVKSVSDEGFLHLWPFYNDTLGRPPRWFVPANQPALVVTDHGAIDGVIATASGHVVGGRNSEKQGLDWNDLFVDVGVRSRTEAAELGISPGCRIVWNPPTRRLGRLIVGKAMDDRAALAIATLVAERLSGRNDLAYELWLASTVQEENGLLGAASLVDDERFDAAIALDVGLTGDFPGPDPLDFPAKLGAGPIVVLQDGSCHYSRPLSLALLGTAARLNLPVQRAVFQHYGSDGAALIRRGVETALLTYPTRYTHSPIETVDEDDVLACVRLLEAFLTSTPGEQSQNGS
jgi:putative aminopeptidase FrvX